MSRGSIRRLVVASAILVLALAAGPVRAHAAPPPTAAQLADLGLARSGLALARRTFWDPRRHWYLARTPARAAYPLAHVWDIVPVFETYDALAVAAPGRATRRAVTAFVRAAERYWNPDLRPVGGYSPYPGSHGRTPTWIDDNGWLGLAFLDAYHATGDRRALRDARRAFSFVVRAGWDRRAGGLWWSTEHSFKAGESLASATLLGAMLYRDTRRSGYLAAVLGFLRWAGRSFRSGALYARTENDPTPMAYVEAPMLAAEQLLCRTPGQGGWCADAAALRGSLLARFPAPLTHGPQYDGVAARWLLYSARLEQDPALYRLVSLSAASALAHAADPSGLYSLSWVGQRIPWRDGGPGLLRTDAGTVSMLAWLAATPPPPGA